MPWKLPTMRYDHLWTPSFKFNNVQAISTCLILLQTTHILLLICTTSFFDAHAWSELSHLQIYYRV